MAKIVIGMSGGVDSTVAALLLKNEGHTVLGVFLRMWKHNEPELDDLHFADQIDRLAQAAAQIEIPFIAVDVRQQFRERVVGYFVQGYRDGITPNPCFFCNRELKWAELLAVAEREGYDYAASGHYARIETDAEGSAHLYRGVDRLKDQSYVLASLRQAQLKRIKFPLGEMTKTVVREVADQKKLRIAISEESQDICFLPEGDYSDFLEEIGAEVNLPGEMVDVQTGDVVGQHRGLAFYTIGQRKGLGVYAPEPRYVIEKDVANNRLLIGKREAMGRTEMMVSSLNWITAQPDYPFSCEIEIRYHSRAVAGEINLVGENQVSVKFSQPVRDLTPGQAAVFYQGQEVIGSGIINAFEGVGGYE